MFFLLVVERVLKGKQSIVRNGVKHGINSLFVIETIKKKTNIETCIDMEA